MDIELKVDQALINELSPEIVMQAAKAVVKYHAADLHRKMQRKATFRGHYRGRRFVVPSGFTKRSIGIRIKDDGLSAVVAPHSSYSPYLEHGTRFMKKAQPFVRPALKEVEPAFIKDMQKIGKGLKK